MFQHDFMGSRLCVRTSPTRAAMVALVFSASVTACTGVAHAQGGPPNPAGHWTVTPSFVLGSGGDLDGSGGGFGLTAGYAWDPHLAWEAAFNTIPSVDQGALLTVDSSIWTLTGNLLCYFTGERAFSPYVVGGLGFGHGSAEIPTNLHGLGLDDESTNFVVDLGGGLTRRLSERTNLKADLRYYIGSDLVPDSWRVGVGIGFDVGHR